VWLTKKGIAESEIRLQVKSAETILTAEELRNLYEWFEEDDTRLVRPSHGPANADGSLTE